MSPSNRLTTFNSLITYFNTNWDFSLGAVRFDNNGSIQTSPTTSVKSEDDLAATTHGFITVSWQPFNVTQRDMATNAYSRQDGLMVFQVFTRKGKGQVLQHEIADKLDTLFQRVEVDGILFREGTTSVVGEQDEWYGITITYRTENNFTIN